jgi:hypothetical protein
MSILQKILTGRLGRPQKGVIYAPEGFGKSTLASQFPEPLFLDLEDSTSQMDVARLTRKDIPTLKEFEATLQELRKSQDFSTIIVDTADWLESMVIDAMIQEEGNPKIKGIEDYGYGKGYVILKDKMTVLLSRFDALIQSGMHVVLLAHSKVSKFEPPDGVGPFDRYELKLSKHVAPLLKEWADILLFGNWRTQVREKDKNESGAQFKGVGGKERQMHCVRSASWDAKNRHNLADSEKWEIGVIQRAFTAIGAPWGKTAPGAISVTPEVPKPGPNSQPSLDSSKNDEIPMSHPAGEPVISKEGAKFDNPAHPLGKICAAHEVIVNSYLVKNDRIKPGQTWRDTPEDFAARILKNPAAFLEACKKQ